MNAPRLTLAEREEISLGIARGDGPRAIARLVGRAPSTISREIRRCVPSPHVVYRAATGQGLAVWRARRPKTRILDTNVPLLEVVVSGLLNNWSPEQISTRLKQDFPADEGMRVSHETIYSWFYVLPRGELKKQILDGLRRHRARRVPQGRIPKSTGSIADMVSIEERPDEVEDRKIPGHWEGDLIIGKQGKSAVATLVERKTRFTMLVALPNGRTSAAVREAIQQKIVTLPAALARSITWDQGSEMAKHKEFSVETGVSVYFAHPRSPWERGSNENTNGLLRQYLPKGTVLTTDPQALDQIANSLNGRPRRTLGWQTPEEAFAETMASAVAMTG